MGLWSQGSLPVLTERKTNRWVSGGAKSCFPRVQAGEAGQGGIYPLSISPGRQGGARPPLARGMNAQWGLCLAEGLVPPYQP